MKEAEKMSENARENISIKSLERYWAIVKVAEEVSSYRDNGIISSHTEFTTFLVEFYSEKDYNRYFEKMEKKCNENKRFQFEIISNYKYIINESNHCL